MQPGGFQPNILALRTLLTALLDELPRSYHSSRVFLQTSSSDPSRCVLGIGFHERVEEHASTLDVTNLRIGFEHDAVKRGEVTFRVNGRLQARSSGAGYLHIEN